MEKLIKLQANIVYPWVLSDLGAFLRTVRDEIAGSLKCQNSWTDIAHVIVSN